MVINIIRKTLAIALLICPLILLVGFTLHFSSFSGFFKFKLSHTYMDAGDMFNWLVESGSSRFVLAHSVVYAAIPFLLLEILCLGYLLFSDRPFIAFIGTTIGLIGSVFLSGVLSSWISFAAIVNVDPKYYEGAKAGLTELTRMTGSLKVISNLALLSFAGLIILSGGLLSAKKLPKWSPALILIGSLLIFIFHDLDNWMFIGTVLMLIGLVPVSRKISKNNFNNESSFKTQTK